ncbi:uncharacterized protein LOC123677494 [Harmonia axyridis]|uniref:uncharacterized protein LOC123677494 n=1 Tax=Harmonia axyridis TaxID=115357 RepID=UPI001E275C77|nr:uncharacterized protein LOC123677494 [Harmonia axyridis]
MAFLQLLQTSMKLLAKNRQRANLMRGVLGQRNKSKKTCREECGGICRKRPKDDSLKKDIPCSTGQDDGRCKGLGDDLSVRKPCPITCSKKPCPPKPCRKRKNPCDDCDCEVR